MFCSPIFLLGALFIHFLPAWSQFRPAAYPLAIRSPYLNSWFTTLNGNSTSNDWPKHWDTSTIMGWSGYVRVDGKTFYWLGNPIPGNKTVLQSTSVTPTRTVFTIVADTVLVNVTFLSPIEPSDLVLQSFPFTYIAVDVKSTDGNQHSVQLYSDISGEWISGERTNLETWNTTQTMTSIYHQASRKVPEPMQEINNVAEDASVYFGMGIRDKLTWQTGEDNVLRQRFLDNGTLTGAQDPDSRKINERFPVFAISVDLGTITATTEPVVWVLGLVRDPVIRYTTLAGSENRSPYFKTRYSQMSDAIDAFISDYAAAERRAVALDQKILSAAQQVSSKYADLVSLGMRQVLAGIDFTIPTSGNQQDIKAFMRDTGTSQQINAIESLYAAFPTLLFLNASLAGYLLEPMLAYQSSSLYNNNFAAANLGASYPSAVGNNARESLHAVEATGDMISMVWAHATFSGQGQLIANYYDLLKNWADYLVNNTMNPVGQTLDGVSKPKMTNLVFQGIIGIRAMASISAAAGHQGDSDKYMATAANYTKQWKDAATDSDHLSSTLDKSTQPSLIYNLFADRLFKFNLVEDSLIESQSTFYLKQNSPKYGLPFDGNVQFAKSHWTAFTAAASNQNARDALIDMIYTRINSSTLAGAFPTVYDVQSGNSNSGFASPAQGGLLSLLALNLPSQKLSIPPKANPDDQPAPVKTRVSPAAVAGGVIGGLAALVVIAAVFFVIRRRRNQSAKDLETPSPFVAPKPIQSSSHLSEAERPLPMTPITSPEMYAGYISPVTSSFVGTSIRSGQTQSTRTRSTRTGWSSSTAAAETMQLRNEVENLRRAMDEIRAQREYESMPPPVYT